MRWMATLCLAGLLTTDLAEARGPYMWGVGPRLGTTSLTGRYPLTWPAAVDADEIAPRRWDVLFGGAGTVYLDGHNRFTGAFGVDLATRYQDYALTVTWNRVFDLGRVDIVAGAGTGFGAHRWAGDDSAVLRGGHLPIRGEAGATFKDHVRAYELLIGVEFRVPTATTWVSADGQTVAAGWGTYLAVSAEARVWFGDFRPPRPTARTRERLGAAVASGTP